MAEGVADGSHVLIDVVEQTPAIGRAHLPGHVRDEGVEGEDQIRTPANHLAKVRGAGDRLSQVV